MQVLIFAQHYNELIGVTHGVHAQVIAVSLAEVVKRREKMDQHLSITAILHLIDHAAVREYLIGREFNLGIREYLIAEDFLQLLIGGFRTKFFILDFSLNIFFFVGLIVVLFVSPLFDVRLAHELIQSFVDVAAISREVGVERGQHHTSDIVERRGESLDIFH